MGSESIRDPVYAHGEPGHSVASSDRVTPGDQTTTPADFSITMQDEKANVIEVRLLESRGSDSATLTYQARYPYERFRRWVDSGQL